MSSRISVWPISSLSIISGSSVDSFFFLSNGKLDCICWREIYNSFVFPRWNPGQAVSSEILNEFVGRTVTSKNPFLPSNSNWKSKKQSTHTRTLTQFSLTRCFPRKWIGLVLSAKYSANLLRWFTIPKNTRTSWTFLCAGTNFVWIHLNTICANNIA